MLQQFVVQPILLTMNTKQISITGNFDLQLLVTISWWNTSLLAGQDVFVSVCDCMRVCAGVCVCLCVCLCVHLCVSLCVCVGGGVGGGGGVCRGGGGGGGGGGHAVARCHTAVIAKFINDKAISLFRLATWRLWNKIIALYAFLLLTGLGFHRYLYCPLSHKSKFVLKGC